MENWDEHKVSQFIEGVGNGKVWLQYAQKCLEDGFDGKTLANVTVDDLVDMGFSRPHARAVISDRDAVTAVRAVPVVQVNSVVTEIELSELQKLALHRELLGKTATQISDALQNLPWIVKGHHTQIDKIVDETVAKWEQARTVAHEKLNEGQSDAKQQLEKALADITEHQRTFEATANQATTVCTAPIAVTDRAALKQRQTQVITLTQQCFSAPFIALEHAPEWRLEWVESPPELPLVDVVSIPCVTVIRCLLPPLTVSVKPSSTYAEVSWHLPPEYSVAEIKFQYHVQLARSGFRPESAPPPYDEKDNEDDFQNVYQGEEQAFKLSNLLVGTNYSLRVRVERDAVFGPWSWVTFDTLKLVASGRLMFDVAGSHKWVVPSGVTEITAILIGGGGGGCPNIGNAAAGSASRLAGVTAGGGEGARAPNVKVDAKGGSGLFKNGGAGTPNGGGAAGGQLEKNGSTVLKYAGRGGVSNQITQRPCGGPFSIERGVGQGAKYGGGGYGYPSGGGGGGYSQFRYKVVPGTSIDIEVGKGGHTAEPWGGADGLVAIAWGDEEA